MPRTPTTHNGSMEIPVWLTETVEQLPITRLEDRDAWDAWVLWISPRPDPRPRDKWFGLLMHHPDGRRLLNLKGDPEVNAIRRESLDWVWAGYHMNKRHWLALDLDHPGFDQAQAEQFVEDAWDVTVGTYPRRLQRDIRIQSQETRPASNA